MEALSHRIWFIRCAVTAFAACISLAISWLQPLAITRLDDVVRDAMLRMAADQTPESRIAIIDIDEKSLRNIGTWPWPRAMVADLIEALLVNQQVRAIGLDIVFPQPADTSGDARLATLAVHTPLTLAQILDYTPRTHAMDIGVLSNGLVTTEIESPMARASGHIANHAGLAEANCSGNIGYVFDPDGTLRHIPARTELNGKAYPSLAEALLNCVNPIHVSAPAKPNGLWRVPYTYAQEAYTVISASDVIRQRLEPGLLRGRYVLVGSSAMGLGDHVSTPLAPLTSGVMVHAAALSGLLDLQQGTLPPPANGKLLLSIWCLLTMGLALWALPKVSAWMSTGLLGLLALLWLATAYLGMKYQLEWSVTAPLLGYACFALVAIPLEWWQAQRRSRQLMATLSHYVAKPVLDEIVRRHLQHSLEPSLCDVTVLVADMEGYTRVTSALSLHDAATLTKGFLDCLTRPVLTNGGTLDRYSGDGLVAFWGAPLPCADQADAAANAALEILKQVARFNQQLAQRNHPTVAVRIGIESGMALVGDLGTDFRSTYTAVGDCINFASRLEAAAKTVGVPVLLGPKASQKLRLQKAVSLGPIHLRNTDTVIEVFTLLSLQGKRHIVSNPC